MTAGPDTELASRVAAIGDLLEDAIGLDTLDAAEESLEAGAEAGMATTPIAEAYLRILREKLPAAEGRKGPAVVAEVRTGFLLFLVPWPLCRQAFAGLLAAADLAADAARDYVP